MYLEVHPDRVDCRRHAVRARARASAQARGRACQWLQVGAALRWRDDLAGRHALRGRRELSAGDREGERGQRGFRGLLDPLGLFLHTSIPSIWSILSAFRPS
jgi:hypothetical protein